MFSIGITQLLKKDMGVELEDLKNQNDEELEKWHMHLFKIGHYKCLILMHDVTRYNLMLIGVKKKDYKDIQKVVSEGLERNMKRNGYPTHQIEAFLNKSEPIIYTKTHNRPTIGCLNDIIRLTKLRWPDSRAITSIDFDHLNKFSNKVIFLKLPQRTPEKAMEEYLGKFD